MDKKVYYYPPQNKNGCIKETENGIDNKNKYPSNKHWVSKTLKYPRIDKEHNMSMAEHIKKIAIKTEKIIATLNRLMPNIRLPKAERRKVLGSLVNSIILYEEPLSKVDTKEHL